MVSQRTMRCTSALRTCLLGLTAVLLVFAACGQNEGGRCQVNSDCASGLKCSSPTGNGQCVPQNILPSNGDAAPDVSMMSGPEVDLDAAVTVDALDSEAVTLDSGAVDSSSLDSAAID